MGDGRFGRLLTAMVTPFDGDGALDLDAAVSLARWLCAHGSDGLVGRRDDRGGPRALRRREALAVRCGGRWRRRAGRRGHVGQPHRARRRAHARGERDGHRGRAVRLPLLLAALPGGHRRARGGDRERDRPARHALRHPRAVRAAHHDRDRPRARARAPQRRRREGRVGRPRGAARLVAEAPSGFEVYSGDDALVLPFLAVGAVGLVSVASHWCGTELNQVLSLFVKGDLDGAIAQHATLLDSFAFESTERWPNPLPAKAALRALGLGVGQCRLPMGDADAELDRAAAAIVARFGSLHA